MAFWKDNKTNPKRQFRFKILGTGVWYWAKSIDKPTVEVSSNSYQLINHKFNYPGVATWLPVTITIIDDSVRTNEIYNYLISSGYNTPNTVAESGRDGIEKNGFDGALNDIIFHQLEADGTSSEEWTLYNSIITNVDFGKLDYSSDELVQLTIQITYDFAELNKGSNAQNKQAQQKSEQEQKSILNASTPAALSAIPGPSTATTSPPLSDEITNNNIDPTTRGSLRPQTDNAGQGKYEKLPGQ